MKFSLEVKERWINSDSSVSMESFYHGANANFPHPTLKELVLEKWAVENDTLCSYFLKVE